MRPRSWLTLLGIGLALAGLFALSRRNTVERTQLTPPSAFDGVPADSASAGPFGDSQPSGVAALDDRVEPAEAPKASRTVIAASEQREAAPSDGSFTASGRVLSGMLLSKTGVSYGVIDGTDRVARDSVEVASDGTWGPVSIELEDAQEFWFRLEGPSYVAEELTAPRPEAHAALVIDFEGETGYVMWFLATNGMNREPLTDVVVEVTWGRDGSEEKATGRSREDGYVKVVGCRGGQVRSFARSPGFGSVQLTGVIPPATPVTYSVEMWPTGRLIGRCIDKGLPVTDFTVTYYRFGQRHEARSVPIFESPDGSFELDDAPLGDVQIVAFVDGYGQTHPATVEVRTNETAEVVLELATPSGARGRVVDQATGEPIESATVEVFASIGSWPVHPLGPPVGVNADGSFELEGIYAAGTAYTVSAPGYSGVTNNALGVAGSVLDLGTIALVPKQELTIRLVAHGSIDPTEFIASSVRSDLIPPTRFDSDGLIVIEEMGIGLLNLRVRHPDHTDTFIVKTFNAGAVWTIDVPIGGPCQLEIEVDIPEAKMLTAEWNLHVTRYVDDDNYVDRAFLLQTPFAKLDLPCDDEFVLRVLDARKTILIEEKVRFGDTHDLFVHLDVGFGAFVVRVVTPNGAPVSGATVLVAAPGTTVGLGRNTDADGRVRLLASGEIQELEAVVVHRTGGAIRGVPVSLSGIPNEEIEIVLDAPAALEIIVMNDGQPVANVECQLVDPTFEAFMGGHVQTTDSSGYARFERLGEGSYDVIGRRTGYEPMRRRVRTSTAEPLVVLMRAEPPTDQ